MEQDIFGRHFVCYFARARVKKAWAQANYQQIRQVSLAGRDTFEVDQGHVTKNQLFKVLVLLIESLGI